jgi:hypothetical protein
MTGLMMTLVAAFALALDAPAAAPAPKTGIELTQKVSTESFNNDMSKSGIADASGAAAYSQTNIKASVAFDMGSGIMLKPWLQERFEVAGNTGTNQLDKMFLRGRTYAGVDATYTLSKALSLVAAVEYRYGAKLTNNTPSTTIATSSSGNVTEQRVTPSLAANGTIDKFNYSIKEALSVYFDTTKGNDQENDLDNQYIELAGDYNFGATFKLNEKNALKIDLYDSLLLQMPSAYQNDSYGDQKSTFNYMYNVMRHKVILVTGDIKPFVGFLMSTTWQHNDKETGTDKNKYEITNNIIGTTLGSDVTAGNLTFNLTADIGVDTATDTLANALKAGYSRAITNPLVTQISSSVKVKF